MLLRDARLGRQSYYEASVVRGLPSAPLQGSIDADVLVVGAGFAGLSAALELAGRGLQVVVLEAGRVCSGASGRNGGQTLVGYAGGQKPFEQQLGREAARQVWAMSLEAISLMDERIARHVIACDRVKGCITVADSAAKARALAAEAEALARDHGFACELVTGADVARFIDSPRYCAAAFEATSGHLHPLKYGLGLARAARDLGVRIFEQSAVTALRRGGTVEAHTAQGRVRAPFAVLAGNCSLAGHGPGVAPEIGARIMPVGTYMLATEPLDPALSARLMPGNAAACDNNVVLDYFRFSADHRLLFGGQVSYSGRTPRRLQAVMQQRMAAVFPVLRDVKVAFVWGGFVDISMNRTPDFGRLGHNIYYLQGFSGHGVAATGLAGRLAAEAIAGQAGRFDVFARLRHTAFPGGRWLRTPTLVLGMAWHRLMEWR